MILRKMLADKPKLNTPNEYIIGFFKVCEAAHCDFMKHFDRQTKVEYAE